ncbi:MAG TPA: SCO1664 family protein [Acidimicrobiales bacterium]|nr:SCO1664 family protein [Acidimicrobiales bacterium]
MHPAERPSPGPLSALSLLREGDIEVKGRLPWSSNGTFLVELCRPKRPGAGDAELSCMAVYKPERGERPLWDYPPGLFRREVAAFVVSRALGWGIVPETIERDGPYGPGSLQRFVDADFREHYFTLLERPEHHDALKAICTLDLVINNGDRKSGHCILSEEGSIFAIDHGLCLHEEPKLRTVIWDFAGEPIPKDCRAALAELMVDPPLELGALLTDDEVEALVQRTAAAVANPIFPEQHWGRSIPWPPI